MLYVTAPAPERCPACGGEADVRVPAADALERQCAGWHLRDGDPVVCRCGQRGRMWVDEYRHEVWWYDDPD